MLPAITTGAGTIWTIGLMGYMDSSINMITLSLPTFVLAIGNAYSTHVVARHHDELRLDGDPVGAARRTIAQIGTPVLVTALTTVLGFGALLAYHIEAIRNLGFFAVFGISSLFLLALTLTPALLSLMPAPPPASGASRVDAWLERSLEAIGRFSMDHRAAVGGRWRRPRSLTPGASAKASNRFPDSPTGRPRGTAHVAAPSRGH